MGRKKKDAERTIIKTCKTCQKEFTHKWHTTECQECYTKRRKETLKNFHENNKGWKIKLKWREKLVDCYINEPSKEEWNQSYNPAITTKQCTYPQCKEIHYADRKYYHPFMQQTKSKAIEIGDIEELIEEIKKRHELKTKEIIEILGLEKGQLIE